MAQAILVTSGKGGAGKSTVCAFLGEALSACGKEVLLLETAHRSLDVLFGVSDAVLFDVGDAVEQRCELTDAMLSVGGGKKLKLICAPLKGWDIPEPAVLEDLFTTLKSHFDFILVDAAGMKEGLIDALAPYMERALIVSAADRVSARDSRAVSDMLCAAGVHDIRLCVNGLPEDFDKQRQIPDLDWLIDHVCAQLIAVIPFDKNLSFQSTIGQNMNLSNLSKMIFDNFAQRILGNYIDLLVR